MTNLLFVDETAQIGGAELNLLLKVRHLQAANWSPQVIVPRDGPLTQLLQETAVSVHTVPRLPLISTSFYIGQRKIPNLLALVANIFLGLVWVWRLARYFRQQQPALVHTVSMSAHIFAGVAARLTGCRLVWHIQDIVNPRSGFGLYRHLLRFWARILPQRIICISRKVQEQFADDSRLQPKLCLLWNAIDVQKFSPASNIESSPDRSELRIATVARLTHWKGQKTALYAAHALKQRGVSFRWFFVGDVTLGAPGYQAHLLNLVHRLRLEDEVQFLGWVVDMPAFYHKVDLLVHLPLEPEPYGLVLAEAMAAGLPIITAVGGGLEALIEDAGGFLLPPGQPQPVADILQQLATNPEERASRGIRARAVAEKTFDPQQYTRDLIAIYQSME